MMMATIWMKHVANKQNASISHGHFQRGKQRRTWLEDECAAKVDIATIACRLDTLVGLDKRANNKRCCLANTLKGAKLDGHRGVSKVETTIIAVVSPSSLP